MLKKYIFYSLIIISWRRHFLFTFSSRNSYENTQENRWYFNSHKHCSFSGNHRNIYLIITFAWGRIKNNSYNSDIYEEDKNHKRREESSWPDDFSLCFSRQFPLKKCMNWRVKNSTINKNMKFVWKKNRRESKSTSSHTNFQFSQLVDHCVYLFVVRKAKWIRQFIEKVKFLIIFSWIKKKSIEIESA